MAENSEKSTWQKVKDKIKSGAVKVTVAGAALLGGTSANAAAETPQNITPPENKTQTQAPAPAQTEKNESTITFEAALETLSEKENSPERTQKRERINSILQSALDKKKQKVGDETNLTQDQARIELTDEKGHVRATEDIQTSRLVDGYDIENGTGSISTTTITEGKEFDKKGRVRVQEKSSHNISEQLRPALGNSTSEREFSHYNEYDKKGNLRYSKEEIISKDERESSAIGRSSGYADDYSFSESQMTEASFDRKGRTTEETVHSERTGSYPSVSDEYIEARRRHDIYDASQEDMSGIKRIVSAHAKGDTNIQVSDKTFKRNGEIKRSVDGSINGSNESYSSFRNGIFRDKSIEISVDGEGKVSGEQHTTNLRGKTKTKELSESKAAQHLQKMRDLLGNSVERFGAENMQDYGNKAPEQDNTQRPSLGSMFDRKIDKEAVDQISEQQAEHNKQRMNTEKGITATDILIKNLQKKLYE